MIDRTFRIDLHGMRFGRLVVKSYSHNHQKNGAYWNCVCDCGKISVVLGGRLRHGTTQSCGCLAKELSAARRRASRKEPKTCSVDGCDRHTSHKGMCGMHAIRVSRYGDPNYVTSHEQFRANCREAALKHKEAAPTTYKKRFNRHEHRVVAEQMLGRSLTKGEIVHHKDGDKHNNHPDNLEVMTQSEHMKLHRDEMLYARLLKHGY